MWAAGVGTSDKAVTISSQYDNNRMEMLRLMVACFSDSLYQSPDSYDSCASLWLEVATSVDTPFAEITFNSLLNVVLGYDPVGWGVPYGGTLATDTARPLMETALQVIVILLDYGVPVMPTETEDEDAESPTDRSRRHSRSKARAASAAGLPFVYESDTEAQGFNIFRKYLSAIKDEDQLNFMFKGDMVLFNRNVIYFMHFIQVFHGC